MKKICMVAYIYGEKYQEYIPLFLFSLFSVYPEYGARVYLDRKMNDNLKSAMRLFENYDAKVIEEAKIEVGLSDKALKFQQIKRCIRWLFYDKNFEEYEAIYIGDIDIFFCPEKELLFEEHLKHCKIIGEPYSNITREYNPKRITNVKSIIRNVVKFGLRESFKFYFTEDESLKRLSGLHFVKTKDYYKNVLSKIEGTVKELNDLADGKSKRYNLCKFNNEYLLHNLMLDSGFSVPEIALGEYNLSESGEQISYRPHHGIHLGIFRGKAAMEAENQIISSELYKNYYKFFKKVKISPEYKELEKLFSDELKQIIKNMEEYYERLEKEN